MLFFLNVLVGIKRLPTWDKSRPRSPLRCFLGPFVLVTLAEAADVDLGVEFTARASLDFQHADLNEGLERLVNVVKTARAKVADQDIEELHVLESLSEAVEEGVSGCVGKEGGSVCISTPGGNRSPDNSVFIADFLRNLYIKG
jgi:hypothetical protein